MNEPDVFLRALDAESYFPPTPDLVEHVSEQIESSRSRDPRASRAMVRVAAVAFLVVLVAAAIPAVRDEVAAWLGIRGVTIVDVTEVAGDYVGSLGRQTTLADVEAVAGFAPTIPSALGAPTTVYASRGVIWMFFAPTENTGEIAGTEVGAIVTQIAPTDGVTILKSIVLDAEVVMLDGDPAFWLEGEHRVAIVDGEGTTLVDRVATNTLLWDRDEGTFRLELDADLATALSIARSSR